MLQRIEEDLQQAHDVMRSANASHGASPDYLQLDTDCSRGEL